MLELVILERMPVAVIVIDNSGIITIANQAAHELFSRKSHDLQEQHVEHVLPIFLQQRYMSTWTEDQPTTCLAVLNNNKKAIVRYSRLSTDTGFSGTIMIANPLSGNISWK